jgi:hypothetical protein
MVIPIYSQQATALWLLSEGYALCDFKKICDGQP